MNTVTIWDSTRKSWSTSDWGRLVVVRVGLEEFVSKRRIAIIGAGPIGLEAALEGVKRGFEVTVYEAGRVGEHLRRFGQVGLFTPFAMNSTPAGRARLAAEGKPLPAEDALLTASELANQYLAPLAALPELLGSIHEWARVTHVGRDRIAKTRGIVAVGDDSRSKEPFLLRVTMSDGTTKLDRADLVLDTSGAYSTPNGTGPGGLPAVGEETLGDRADRWIPRIMGDHMQLDLGARVLLVGDGHSAATALLELEELNQSRTKAGGKPVHVCWVRRDRETGQAFAEVANDPLPARHALVSRANAVARSASWLEQHPGAVVESYAAGPNGIRVRLQEPSGKSRTIDVDRVLALTGYRPDLELCRELQIHLCYASEAPMKLASAILTASLASPGGAGDCLSQTSHGAETLQNPEPDFYVLGAKSYGRNPLFLLTIGHQQIQDVYSLMGSPEAVRTAAPSLVS